MVTDALIRLRLSEIEYDVKFDTWGRGNAAEKPNKKVLYTGGKMRDWLLRRVENAVGEIMAALRWCARDHAHMTDNEILDPPDYWEIRLRWEGSPWTGSENGLKSYAHQFVVSKALAEWYAMVGLPAEIYVVNADTALGNLVNAARRTSVDAPRFTL